MAAIAVEQAGWIGDPPGLTTLRITGVGFQIDMQAIAIGLIHHRQTVMELTTLQGEHPPADALWIGRTTTTAEDQQNASHQDRRTTRQADARVGHSATPTVEPIL